MKKVTDSDSELNLDDNGGRRSNAERRQFKYLMHIPERRSGKDSRTIPDKRKPRKKN